jgi:ribosomal protein S8
MLGGDIMTPEKFAEEMTKIQNESSYDEELVHIRMDNLMSDVLESLGYIAGIKIFDETGKWYS